jgi:imidazolonepropionase-like amidohydrolase
MNSGTGTRTILDNVRVFDGATVGAPTSVVIDDELIGAETTDGTRIDCTGHTILPGLIDAHVHLDSPANLEKAAHWGVTTMLDMGTQSLALIGELRRCVGGADIRSAIYPAAPPGATPTARMGYPASAAVDGPPDAARFVGDRAAEGADLIKIVLEDPKMPGSVPLDEATVRALVEAARAREFRTVAHAVTYDTFALALRAGVDIITHAPLDRPLDDRLANQIAEHSVPVVPTLIMMRSIIENLGAAGRRPPGVDFANCLESVAALNRAGATILVGTDANDQDITMAKVPHGEGVHTELALLLDAGLTPAQVLAGATTLSARRYGLDDRGRIEPGARADLLLVDGDPTADITKTSNITGVWIAGKRVR